MIDTISYNVVCSDALNSVMAERENEAMNHVDKDSMERLNEQQLIAERSIHQQIITGLQQQLSDATAVRYLHQYVPFILLVILAYTHCTRGHIRSLFRGGGVFTVPSVPFFLPFNPPFLPFPISSPTLKVAP